METEEQYTLDDIYRSAETQKNPLCERVLQSKDLLDMNKQLMDLEDGIISGQTKLKVKEIVERPIQRLIKHRFQTMFLEDKMYQALPNLNSWLATTFNRMNHDNICFTSHKGRNSQWVENENIIQKKKDEKLKESGKWNTINATKKK